MNQKDNPKLTITLTDARPVTIDKEAWPVLASATHKWWDGQHESQANRTERASLTVREEADTEPMEGRKIVYGVYAYSSAWQGESGCYERAGETLDPDDDVIAAINRVAESIAGRLDDDAADTMRRMARECVADLPAVELS